MKIPNKNTLQTLVASFALFSCNLYSQDFKDAKDNLLRKNQISLEKLKDTRKRIQNEKIPLASNLSALERKVSEKRRALDRLIRLRDNKSVGLNSLKKEVEGRKTELQFIGTLSNDYLANFEARLHSSEIDKNQDKLSSIKKVLDGESNDKEKIDARLELLKLSVSRTKDLIGGVQFNGQALDENGKVCDGTFLLSGPISYFQEKDGPLSGLTQTGRDLKPRIFPLDNERNSAISAYFNLEAGSEGILPIDSTLGDAVKVAAAEDTIIEHIQKGGTWAYPIVIAALIAFLISLMKYLQLSKITKPRNSAVNDVLNFIKNGEEKSALKRTKSMSDPFCKMFSAGIHCSKEGKKMVDEAMYEELLATQPKLESYLPVIQVTAATAPLMGLLGTVTGMIKTFKQITLFGTGDAKSLSEGISEALITTELGLIAAIPSLVLYAILSRKSKAILAEMERLSSLFLNGMSKKKEHLDKTESNDGDLPESNLSPNPA